ncbi:MAG TPA: DbpA RNA binding domain-containing protein [Clostridia bacterium]|nr:DbpA RNA binding domain-containing protein [Clostridia bacterium]
MGSIDIFDKFSFVEIPVSYVEEIMTSVKNKKIKGKRINIEVSNKKKIKR